MSDPKVGIGGAPTRATTLPTDSVGRKTFPIASCFTDYFPDAICAIANLSFAANEQHHPGAPVHWDRATSTDEADTLLRHFLQRGSLDTDGKRHSAKLAWRALALLQKEIECEEPQALAAFSVAMSKVNWDKAIGPAASDKTIHLVKDGPYCFACNKLAELHSELTDTYFCHRCVNEDLGLYTVLDGGKQ